MRKAREDSMTRVVSDTLYAASAGSAESRAAYRAFSLQDDDAPELNEGWFRDLIAGNPLLVIKPCIAAELIEDDEEEWFLWQTEFPVDGHAVDVLLVSASGRIALIETKLARNPEKRREVVAQVFEYALAVKARVAGGSLRLPSHLQGKVKEDELTTQGMLLIIAGDELDQRAVRLAQAVVAGHRLEDWTMAMIDIALFGKMGDAEDAEWLVVPQLRGVVVPVEREIIRVVVDGAPSARVELHAAPPAAAGSSRSVWNGDAFKQALARMTPSVFKSLAEDLLKLAEDFQLETSWGTSKAGSVTLKRNGAGLVEVYLGYRNLGFRPRKFERALGSELGASYRAGLEALFPNALAMKWPTTNPTEVEKNAQALLAVLREHVEGAARA